MSITEFLQTATVIALKQLYNHEFSRNDFQINETRPDFEGDYTIVLFALLKPLGQNPGALGQALGERLLLNHPGFFSGFQIVKGFLNLTIGDGELLRLVEDTRDPLASYQPQNPQRIMVEYSSPNTNKPLHLGHLRNNFLGWSVAEILKATGNEVVKASIINDRGIHICKSMIAWKRFANGETPETTGMKGDHLVGKYYVKFNEVYQQQVADLVAKGMEADEAKKEAAVMKDAQQMLVDWEQGDEEVRELWRTMNEWVYAGFDQTYKETGCDFDQVYFESNTYLLGKDIVNEGLDKGVLFKKEDGSVWINLEDEGLGEKLLLRGDGTSVYMTQDLGLAVQKFEEFQLNKSIYVIGDEQNHHMRVLAATLAKLGYAWAREIFHLSYGMVELTTGKMKSREGTVVDADDIVREMTQTAAQHTQELGKVEDFSEQELEDLYKMLGLGAAKFYLLRVDPKKRMVFNPEESIDFHGFTGPFVQYTHARIRSILRKAPETASQGVLVEPLLPLERTLLLLIERYTGVVEEAGRALDPSLVAGYAFQLARLFNSFYAELSVLRAESEQKKQLRLLLAQKTANILRSALRLLGIDAPERM